MRDLFYYTGMLVWACWVIGTICLLTLHLYGKILVRRAIRKSLAEAETMQRKRDELASRGLIPWIFNKRPHDQVVSGFHVFAQSEAEAAEKILGAIR